MGETGVSDIEEIGNRAEAMRRKLVRHTPRSHKSAMGQFHTPKELARWMAELFQENEKSRVSLLDPGAGIGQLTLAFLAHARVARRSKKVNVLAVELDSALRETLATNLEAVPREPGRELSVAIEGGDFIELAYRWLKENKGPRFTHAIMNPPYKKIATRSAAYEMSRRLGVRTTNLYAVFVALSLGLLEEEGELVAITPRSFFNGRYFRPFREYLLAESAIRRIHVFDSRRSPFSDDNVLQENVIVLLQKRAAQRDVVVSWSSDAAFGNYSERAVPLSALVEAGDAERVLHLPAGEASKSGNQARCASATLEELGLEVLTGPVVDFRLREELDPKGQGPAAPLLYASNIEGLRVIWPAVRGGKPQRIAVNRQTERWLLPAGTYVVVRRFSSKEEARRLVAAVVSKESVPGRVLGVENHLNVIRTRVGQLGEEAALGLAAFLRSEAADKWFRSRSGSTQVNASDLRKMRYPPMTQLIRLGAAVERRKPETQTELDELVEEIRWQGA